MTWYPTYSKLSDLSQKTIRALNTREQIVELLKWDEDSISDGIFVIPLQPENLEDLVSNDQIMTLMLLYLYSERAPVLVCWK